MSNLAEVIYCLCAATSALAAWMLWRSYRASGSRLLFWSAICFTGLTLNNVMAVVDTIAAPEIDFALLRTIPAVLGVGSLLYGFIMETA